MIRIEKIKEVATLQKAYDDAVATLNDAEKRVLEKASTKIRNSDIPIIRSIVDKKKADEKMKKKHPDAFVKSKTKAK